ncbi:3-oxoacyl-[acyl-carrier-protein] synthase III [Desulfuromonas soudanensis]|uniref:3-oxoacyl-[acyl-carrier-protein] synthase III n=1 Tax=Desulfuromonas soudanensis TaxID=1603606 RepID=A0A0M3QG52_9BACT|nr:ketoacyl-ACP synthase III [Desulfuromonas soudanensis]ALC17203.1 3-oxoacyl-[acyl-carrier-protein] synthase III [Desulfuromonas soudanensis]
MLGIEEIGTYLPIGRISNYDRKSQFGIDDFFIEEKIGVRRVSVKSPEEETSDLCLSAFEDLQRRISLNKEEIEAVVVVTQNPDYNIPHTSAIVHGKLGLPSRCAAFDISLGCSGFVYALSVFQAFMAANGMKRGLLFTADPYSKVVDPQDKNTTLLFGDGAAVTLISEHPRFVTGRSTFGTLGSEYQKLICRDSTLFMNGRAIFNFAAKVVPDDLREMAAKNGIALEEIDRFLIHQGSKIIVDTIAAKLGLPAEKVPYATQDYGNTVSSTIPILLQNEFDGTARTIAICGFGVGLSWASSLLRRV